MTLQLFVQYKDKEYYVEVKPDATVGDLEKEVHTITKVNNFELSFGGMTLGNGKDSLADLSLCNESKIDVVDIEYEDVKKVLEDYSEDALLAYMEVFGLEKSEVDYEEFSQRHMGWFYDDWEFIGTFFEENEAEDMSPGDIQETHSKHKGYYFRNW